MLCHLYLTPGTRNLRPCSRKLHQSSHSLHRCSYNLLPCSYNLYIHVLIASILVYTIFKQVLAPPYSDIITRVYVKNYFSILYQTVPLTSVLLFMLCSRFYGVSLPHLYFVDVWLSSAPWTAYLIVTCCLLIVICCLFRVGCRALALSDYQVTILHVTLSEYAPSIILRTYRCNATIEVFGSTSLWLADIRTHGPRARSDRRSRNS